jgi:hypothetical protein
VLLLFLVVVLYTIADIESTVNIHLHNNRVLLAGVHEISQEINGIDYPINEDAREGPASKKRCPIPPFLWDSAIELTQHYPDREVARVLRLNPDLKELVHRAKVSHMPEAPSSDFV